MGKNFVRFRKIIFYILNKRRFKFLDITSKIIKPIILTPHYICLGKYVQIYHHARIQGVKQDADPCIIFEDYVTCQQNLHLTCANSISIGSNTAIAANVTITDINHPYEDVTIPIEKQKIIVTPVRIGSDCKIYNNCVILPGTNIGDHCVVGANSVVQGNFPGFSVIVGIPARIIKRYSFEKGAWLKTNEKGEFINE